MPDGNDFFSTIRRRLEERDAAAENELAPRGDAEHELARKKPLILDMHAIFYNDIGRPDTSGRLMADEGQAWAYGNGLKIKPRRVTVIVERE